MGNTGKRRQYSAEEKMEILKRHFVKNENVSDIFDDHKDSSYAIFHDLKSQKNTTIGYGNREELVRSVPSPSGNLIAISTLRSTDYFELITILSSQTLESVIELETGHFDPNIIEMTWYGDSIIQYDNNKCISIFGQKSNCSELPCKSNQTFSNSYLPGRSSLSVNNSGGIEFDDFIWKNDSACFID